MDQLDSIGERIRQHLEDKNTARERALQLSRKLIRSCSKAIRAVHRSEHENAESLVDEAKNLANDLQEALADYPELIHAGYTQSALKEFAEASIVHHLVSGEPYVPYLGGLAEAAGEMRRRILDILRHDDLAEAERLLDAMDDIYGLLVTIDFPDALTNNIRRTTDMVRGVTERTRGDLTTSSQQRDLKRALEAVENSARASRPYPAR
jgi:translin